jgi:endoglucanase
MKKYTSKSILENIKNKNPRFLLALMIVVVVAAIGSYLLIASHAATPEASVGADSGTLANGATKGACSGASDGDCVTFGSTASSTAPNQTYTVSGGSILNASGKAIMVQGVDRDTTEWGCGTAIGGGGSIPASDFTTMHNSWNANIVRVAMSQNIWLWGIGGCSSSQYQSAIAAIVSEAQSAGLIVILDLHWSSADVSNPGNAGGQKCMADQYSNTFWNQVATDYKSNHGVWFELYNEPELSSWSAWENGDTTSATCGFPIVGMQALYNTVRATGATNLVLAGGTGYASTLAGVPLLSGTNIVYAIHPYANSIDGGDPSTWSNSDWTNRFGYLVQEGKAPVIATEFGDPATDSDGTCGESTYTQGILNYFYYYKIGFTAWAWYTGSCSYPVLITNSSGTCQEDSGCVIQRNMKSPPSPSSP